MDLTAAFDTTDHSILLNRLHHDFGKTSIALEWFLPYLTNRTQSVSIHCHILRPAPISFGVPQLHFPLSLKRSLSSLIPRLLSTQEICGPSSNAGSLWPLIKCWISVAPHQMPDLCVPSSNAGSLWPLIKCRISAAPHQMLDLTLSMQKCFDDLKT